MTIMYGANYNIQKWKIIFSVALALLLAFPSMAIGDNYRAPAGEGLPTDVGFDDCESTEVTVDGILSPPSHGWVGLHDVTANFGVVGITINGNRDVDENEPWVEHETSPDNNGTPNVKIYTSCDENFMYVAFENETGNQPVTAGEIFVDYNSNDSWDGPYGDIFLSINYGDMDVKDYNGNNISSSQVGWGDFVEVKIPKTYWPDCNKWGYRVRSEACDAVEPCIVTLPAGDITAQVIPDNEGYFDITLNDVPEGYDVENGSYLGWCIEYGTSVNDTPHPMYLHSSYCPPPILDHENWSMVNYVLNNKQGDYWDIQLAIWHFINFGPWLSPTPTPIGQAMIDDALINGNGFIPGINDVVAVICDPVVRSQGFQYTIIEVLVPEGNCSWNPNWGNNSHNSTTPPDNEFLNFACNYGYNCSCGIAFKALADIYEIHSGGCYVLYETDFEEKYANITQEWKAKSLDGEHGDTWELSTNRSKSTNHSYHCTQNEYYYGNAYDVLEMKNLLDLSNMINVSFSFWSWCEGDSYSVNDYMQIADYGDVEFYTYLNGSWTWISLLDLCISNIYHDNDWIRSTINIDASRTYKLNGENISGEELLQDGSKFRFAWKSDPQFQYEGWYVDDIEIMVCEDEWYNDDEPLWSSHALPPDYWCIPFGSTEQKTFPLQWNATEEGKYLLKIEIQEESPWCGKSENEKIIIIGDIHDIAVTDVDSPILVEPGEDVPIEGTIKNVGSLGETDVVVQATLKKNGQGSPIWERTTIISSLNVSEEKKVDFTWEDVTYCDYLLEIKAILPEDEIPANNSKSKWILVATTLFEDHMNSDCNWSHRDLTGGEGHWNICTSGYDNYLWCGVQATTKYGNNWNDVARISESFNLAAYNEIYLNFDTYHELNESDYGYVEVSKDGGRHWATIAGEGEFAGYSDWVTKTYDISAYNTGDVLIRFRFFSNESIADRGWIIDNITITVNGTTVIFSDGFEYGTDQWIIERLRAGDWWQLVQKATVEEANNMAWWCGDELADVYPANLNNVLTLEGYCSNGIDLTKAFEADVFFSTWHNLSTGDAGYLEITDDDGATWDLVGTLTGVSGDAVPTWVTQSYNIADYVGGNIRIRFRFVSDNENESEGWYVDDVTVVAKLDETPPETTCTISGTIGENNWYVSNVQVTLTAVDDYSGVKNIYYKLDGGGQTTYTSSIAVSDNGVHTVEYWSDDNIGNTEMPHGSESFKIDTVDPIVNITKPDIGIYWRDHKIWPLIKWSLFNWTPPIIIRDITVIAVADDGTSGVDYVEFYVDDILMSTNVSEPFEWNWDERVFFTHVIKVIAYDEAGNTNSLSREVRIFNINLLG